MTRRLGGLTVLVMAVLAACGGAPGTGGPGATGNGATTPGPGATAQGGGNALDNPCSLLTAEEAQAAIGSGPLTATPAPGDPANCRYALADGEEALVIDIMKNGAQTQFQTFLDAGSAEAVSGIGDQALFERGSRRLLVLTGGTLVYVFPKYVAAADPAFDASKAIAEVVVARLTGAAVPTGAIGTVPPVVNAETACDLLTAEEVASVVGKGPMKADSSEFAAQFCTFSVVSSGEVVLSVFLQAKGGGATYESTAASTTTEPVTGVGEKAMFEPSSGILFVLQGDAMLNVNVFGADSATVLEQDKALAQIALTHL